MTTKFLTQGTIISASDVPKRKLPKSPISRRLLAWWDADGRKDLPWQQEPTTYHVWVSEIMLQQTQVTTVIPYYQRFILRFPNVSSLANASLDEVLHHWSGLGYYARARNLHKAAQIICAQHHGVFPQNFEAIMRLPGIGRSTAGAILALAAGQRYFILDGNVKRVLTRLHAIEGWPGHKEIENNLWLLAQQHTPWYRVAHYTQAIMDLGAMICTRSHPSCERCPVNLDCLARQQNRIKEFPTPKPRADLPVRITQMLLVQNDAAAALLIRRPPSGVWGGLWSLPECAPDEDVVQWCRNQLGLYVCEEARWPAARHTFSHFHLDIHPVLVRVNAKTSPIIDDAGSVWYNPRTPQLVGVAAPVKRLLMLLT